MNVQGEPGASPAIDRNKGLHNVLDPVKDKYKIIFENTGHWDRAKAQAMVESALAGMANPPDVINAANDGMALGILRSTEGAQSHRQGRADRLRCPPRGPAAGPRR